MFVPVVALAIATCTAVGVYRGKYYRSLRQYYTLICVGHAALQYEAECGERPTCVEDLLRRGFLRTDASGEYVDTRRGTHGWRVLLRDAMRVKLSFPADPNAYELENGLVINRATGDQLILVDMDDPAVWREHVRYANRHLGPDWLRVVHGEPLYDW